MLFPFGITGKTIKELRKNRGLTAREIAFLLKTDAVEILNIDNMKLKDVPEPLKTKITPILRGDDLDRIPWL